MWFFLYSVIFFCVDKNELNCNAINLARQLTKCKCDNEWEWTMRISSRWRFTFVWFFFVIIFIFVLVLFSLYRSFRFVCVHFKCWRRKFDFCSSSPLSSYCTLFSFFHFLGDMKSLSCYKRVVDSSFLFCLVNLPFVWWQCRRLVRLWIRISGRFLQLCLF